jgi:hypothetical protein
MALYKKRNDDYLADRSVSFRARVFSGTSSAGGASAEDRHADEAARLAALVPAPWRAALPVCYDFFVFRRFGDPYPRDRTAIDRTIWRHRARKLLRRIFGGRA